MTIDIRDDEATTRADETTRLAAMRERRAAARTERLGALLEQRPELAGVHRPADWAAEAVRWSA